MLAPATTGSSNICVAMSGLRCRHFIDAENRQQRRSPEQPGQY